MREVAIYRNPSGFNCYGAAKALWSCKDPEVILSGPYETGKTLAALFKLHALCCKYPQSRALMIRKTYNSLCQSAVVSYEQKVLPLSPKHPKCPVRKFGGEKPSWYDYPNGSRIVVGGLDNADKVLSAEYDFIYVNQAEELTLDEWEKLSSRATGRAGNAPYAQLIGDCNPASQFHWILKRDRITLLESRHKDNPTLFSPETGEITAQGRKTMDVLDNLTGIRKKRGRDGLWVAAEGQVHEFDPAIHMLTTAQLSEMGITFVKYLAAVDWGYSNPGVIQVWGIDNDGRCYRIRETYMTRKLIGWWVERGKAYDAEYGIDAFICDPAEPKSIAEFNQAGLTAIGADNAIEYGIDKVNERLTVQPDGRPRLYLAYDALDEIDRDLESNYKPTCTEEEIPGYVYPTVSEKKNEDEKPVKKDDHGCNTMRYLCAYLADEPPPPKSVSRSMSATQILKQMGLA